MFFLLSQENMNIQKELTRSYLHGRGWNLGERERENILGITK